MEKKTLHTPSPRDRETDVDSSRGVYHTSDSAYFGLIGCASDASRCKLIGMPELPDITAYIRALELRILGQPLEQVRVASAFLLRTAQPPLASVEGRVVRELRRIGKRIAIGLEGDLWVVLPLDDRRTAALAATAEPSCPGGRIWRPSTFLKAPWC